MSGTLQINERSRSPTTGSTSSLFTLIVFGMLLLVLKRTRLGLDIRAVSQNRAMARAIGIRSGWVDAMTFGLGSGIAGVAGVALSQLTNVGPNLGQSYIIDSFMVVVFGGVGNLWGTLIGGMSLGIVNKLLEPYAGAVLGKIVVLVALILFIQRRPRGLFPQTGRAAEGVMIRATHALRDVVAGDRDRAVFVMAAAGRRRRAGAGAQPRRARVVAVAPVDVRADADRQVHVLRDARAGGRSDLGLSAAF